MKKADVHVHSHFSSHPSEWFLKRIGASESYTKPETVYARAKKEGMDFVTLTDHNCITGSVYLKELYPSDTFTGVETTAYFPEDHCKVHVLIWGLNEKQFNLIEKVRGDIYDLRDLIKEENLAHAVAHATFSINKLLSLEHIEKLILLFDYFEGINGCRTRYSNDVFMYALQELTPQHIDHLYTKYKIEPFSTAPWHKGLVGGSDDHSGFFIAKTYTQVKSMIHTPDDYLAMIKNKASSPYGRHNDYRGFAFSLYKIAYDFSKTKSSGIATSLFHTINSVLFEGKPASLRNKITLKKMKFSASPDKKNLICMIARLIKDFETETIRNCSIDKKVDQVYEHAQRITDELIRISFMSIKKSISEGDLISLVKNFSSIMPAVFISVPFFTTINVLHESREVIEQIEKKYNQLYWPMKKQYLWFTDTITDLNGVSETIQKISWLCYRKKIDVAIVTCCLGNDDSSLLPPSTVILPCITSVTPSFFSTFTLRIPSLLHALRLICQKQPDEIIISTPGPVGLIGILAARLLHIPCTGIYHTDFTDYARKIIADSTITKLVEEYIRWFYSLCTAIRVPTHEYMRILEQRGYSRSKMKLFKRGIDKEIFTPQSNLQSYLEKRFGVAQGINLLYTGRISKEKNVDQLMKIYESVRTVYDDINVILCGDGPELSMFKRRYGSEPRIYFTGRIARKELPKVYSSADMFVFPSTTDTFGMSVLEAQACGLPAIVSDKGGPQEIVLHNLTGYVVPADNAAAWHDIICQCVRMIKHFPEQYLEMRYHAWQMVEKTYDWNTVLADIFPYKESTRHDMPLYSQGVKGVNECVEAA